MLNKRNRLANRFVWAALVVTVLLSPGCGGRSAIVGSYQTVSESEWAVTLNLKEGGVAEINMETWQAGEYDQRNLTKIQGRWTAKGNIVTLEYKGITDTLVYDEKLSVQTLGYKGGAPGLIQVRAFDERSLISFYPLWKLPHKF